MADSLIAYKVTKSDDLKLKVFIFRLVLLLGVKLSIIREM